VNQHPGRHAVKFGTNWGLAPIDDNSKNSLHLSQGLLSTHKEELEGDHSPKEPLDSLANMTNGFWSGGDAAPLAGQSKRLVDIIQVAIFIHRNLFIDLTINYCAWIPHYIIYCPVGFRCNLPALKFFCLITPMQMGEFLVLACKFQNLQNSVITCF
jgi:hypothetical protein